VQSLLTVSSLFARCSSLLSSQATCLLTSSRTASSGATSDFSRPPDRELLDPPAETLRVAALDPVATVGEGEWQRQTHVCRRVPDATSDRQMPLFLRQRVRQAAQVHVVASTDACPNRRGSAERSEWACEIKWDGMRALRR
jgi:hypothetical protein